MTEFKYLTPDREYNTFFLQLPKLFITSQKYRELSSDAKIAYTLLRDRSAYSMQNNLVDEKNRIYFLFTDEDLAYDLSVSRNTARKAKQELINANLLKKVDMGYNKKEHKRNASRHYLAELEVSASDVYPIHANNEKNLKNAQNVDLSHGANFEHRVNHKESAKNVDMTHGANFEHSDTMHGANFEQELDRTIYKDIKDIKDSQKAIIQQSFDSHSEKNEEQLIDDIIDNEHLVDFYGNRVVEAIKTYSFKSLETFKVYINKLEFSLKSVEKEKELSLNTIDNKAVHDELYKTFKRVILQYKQGEVNNINNYLFTSFKKVFESYADMQINEPTIHVPLHAWTKESD